MKIDSKKKSEIVELWSPVIGFFRCYGVIPLRKCDKEPYFEKCFGSLCWSFLLSALYNLALGIGLLCLKESSGISFQLFIATTMFVDYLIPSAFIVAFFMVKSDDLVRLLQIWIDTEKILTKLNITLGKATFVKCWILFLALIILTTLENYFYLFGMIFLFNSTDVSMKFEGVYGQELILHPYIDGYDGLFSAAIIILNSLIEIAWVAGDFLIGFTSIVLCRYYEALQEEMNRRSAGSMKAFNLEEFRLAQMALSALVNEVDKFLSPLVLVTVSCNLLYILAILCSGLEELFATPTLLNLIIINFAFNFIIIRFSFSTYMASCLNEMSAIPMICLFDQPSLVGGTIEEQKTRLMKMDLMIHEMKGSTVGLSIGPFFYLTKESIGTIFGLIVTYEIVLLQMS